MPFVALAESLAAYCCTPLRVRLNAARPSQDVVSVCVVDVAAVCAISQGWPARLRLRSSMMPRQQSMPSTLPLFHGRSSVPTRLAGHCDRSLLAWIKSKFQMPEFKICRETHWTFDQFDTEGMNTQQCLLHHCDSGTLQEHLSALSSDLSLNRSPDLSEQTPD